MGERTAVPSRLAPTTFLARRTASCCDTVDWSRSRIACSSRTPRSRTRRSSRIRMRIGCARALKNSALKDCSSVVAGGAVTKISYIRISLYLQVTEQRAVHRGGPRHGRVEREPCRDRRLPRAPHRAGARRVAEDLEHRAGECVRVRGRDEPPRLAVADELRGPAHGRGDAGRPDRERRSEEHTSELQSPCNLVCRLLLE